MYYVVLLRYFSLLGLAMARRCINMLPKMRWISSMFVKYSNTETGELYEHSCIIAYLKIPAIQTEPSSKLPSWPCISIECPLRLVAMVRRNCACSVTEFKKNGFWCFNESVWRLTPQGGQRELWQFRIHHPKRRIRRSASLRSCHSACWPPYRWSAGLSFYRD